MKCKILKARKICKKTEYTFKVGDVVWCVIYGKGVVKNIVGEGTTYPIVVDFENEVYIVTYTHDGKVSSSGQRTLFFSEPKIEALTTRPFTPMLIGKKIVVTLYNGSLFVGEVIDEDEDLILFQYDEYIKKKLIKELYIMGENVVKINHQLKKGLTGLKELLEVSNAYNTKKQQEQVENVRKNAPAKLTEEEKQALWL